MTRAKDTSRTVSLEPAPVTMHDAASEPIDAAGLSPFAPSHARSDLSELVLPAEPPEIAEAPDETLPSWRPLYERAAFPLLITIAIYAAARSVALAVTKHLWFDEIATQVVSRQRDLSAIWAALKTGADGNPPPFYLIERAAAALPLDEHIAYRLPSILALPFTLICLYLFVRRNDGPVRAFVSACVLLLSQIYTWFAAEARPYSLLMACVAFALLCYQRAGRRRWAFGLFISLALAMSLHYYALFVFVPFVAAELTLTWRTRRPRLTVWLALLASLAPLAIFWKLLTSTRAIYGAHLWSSPHLQWQTVLASYSNYFGTQEPWGWALAGLCCGAIVLCLWRGTPGEAFSAELDDAHEHVLALGFLFMPAIGFLGADVAHGGIVPRYCLSAVFGVALGVRCLLRPWRGRTVLGAAAFILFVVAVQEIGFWSSPDRHTPPGNAATSLQSLVSSAHRDDLPNDLPVIVADPIAYLEIQHYAAPELKRRLVDLVDPAKAVEYVQTDSAERGLLALRNFVPLNVQDYSDFTASHPAFLLYANHDDYEWTPSRLADDGAAPRLLVNDGSDSLYLVEPAR